MPEAKPIARSFSAVLTRSAGKLGWVVVRLPFDSVKIWGTRKQLRVKGQISGFDFQSSVFPTGDGHHTLLVNKRMQKGGKVQPGMEARFRIEPDLEKREVETPPELERALRVSKRLQKFYQSMTPSMRRFISSTIASARQPATRVKRAEQAAEFLMETMEAEVELPPLLRLALARNPEAAEGWRRLPPSHRRSHLLGIFYYRSHEARLRRLDKAMAEMIAYGSK